MQSSVEETTQASWHSSSVEDAFEGLASSASGLSSAEAATRLATYGPNQLIGAPPVSALKLLLDEFRSPLVLVLIGAAAVLAGVEFVAEESGHLIDAGLIALIVVLNACLGFSQNYRASRGIEALNRLAAPSATVLRDGVAEQVDAKVLVPGDVVLLEEGSRIPADGRVISSIDLSVDEAALTGESLPVRKNTQPVSADAALAERFCMAYSGTVVMRGRGRMLIARTGMQTEVGGIAAEVQTTESEPTVFQREISRLAARIGWAVAVLIGIVAVLQLVTGDLSLLETFITAVALAVAAVPEGLPVVLSLALAFGTRRMLDRKALVRSLPVVEIVGAAEVICTDKTGTVTEGRMTMRRVATLTEELDAHDITLGAHEEPIGISLLVAGLCNNAHRHPEHGYVGDPTETALLEFAVHAGAPLDEYERKGEVPFTSERRMMSVAVQHPVAADGLLLTKGALEAVLPLCTSFRTPDGVSPLSDEERNALLEQNVGLAGQALRVLAFAYKEQPADAPMAEAGLTFAALGAMSDPPRPEATHAIEAAHRAGIRVVMITGDNSLTAAAIGKEVGLDGEAIEAKELDGLDETELKRVINETSIFARAEPRHKVLILRTLKEDHDVVLMTGDGVNDAPALHNADVGVAMGIKGTDVARDTSDMVLLDDNLATIVAAVEEGRRIFRNIKKFVNYMLTGNLAEVLVILVATVFGYLPVTAVQILWINLVTDSGPAVALASDPAPQGAMREPPRHGAVLGRSMAALVGSVGVVITIILIATFFVGLRLWDLDTARTMTFTGFVVQEYLRLLVIRIQEGMPICTNRWLWASVSVSLLMQAVILYTPIGSAAFGTVPLGLEQWGILLAGLLVGFAATTVTGKLVVRRFGPL
ncbi:MAG: cation-transporting P-type ATPase [Chloroflexi bacterium]|nr:cation-transporting P-type ATPase [Chloroflexota bacterium]